MKPFRAQARKITNLLEDIWGHECFIDECIILHLSMQAGARLTPEEEAKAWVGEVVVSVLEETE